MSESHIRFTVTGMAELKAKMRKMDESLAGRTLVDVADVAAKLVEAGAKRRAPVDTGALRASIFTQIADVSATQASIDVGPAVHYAIHQEYGTRYMKVHPFMRPTLDEDKGEIQRAMSSYVKMLLESI